MISLKKVFSLSLLCFMLYQANAQTGIPSPSPINIDATVLDTLKVKTNSTLLQMHWLGDTITVSMQKENVRLDSAYIAKYRKALKDSTMWSTQEEIDESIQRMKTGAQNCYSYAIEKYFDRNELFDQSLFGPTTSMDRASIEKLLSANFKEVERFSLSLKKI